MRYVQFGCYERNVRMSSEPIVPGSKSVGGRKRVIGVVIAVASLVILVVAYDLIPAGSRFPAIVLAAPTLAAAAGLFQAITGLTLFEVNSQLSTMPPARKTAVVALLLVLLLGVLGILLKLLLMASGL
jgi:hypothetical protein